MKKFISMLLVLAMTVVSFSGLQCFAEEKEKQTFDVSKATVEETIKKIEQEIKYNDKIDGETKAKLIEKLKAAKSKSKSDKHMVFLVWDKVKGTVRNVGLVSLGAIVGLFAGACIFSDKSSSKLALGIDALITSSSTLSACKRWLTKTIAGNDIYYGIKEDIVKIAGYTSIFSL